MDGVFGDIGEEKIFHQLLRKHAASMSITNERCFLSSGPRVAPSVTLPKMRGGDSVVNRGS